MSNRISMIKHCRVFGRTLANLGILNKDLKVDAFTPSGNKLDKIWALIDCRDYVARLTDKFLTPEQIYCKQTILIDDMRDIKADTVCRDYESGIGELRYNGPYKKLYLDHDLASYDENGKELTGYDIVCWLEEYPQYAPKEIVCVSSNPVGRKRIEQVAERIYNKRKEV